MMARSKIIAITGAESTGKSTLAESLSVHYQAPIVPEIAREYVEKLNRPYNYNDVEIIARQQINLLNTTSTQNNHYIFIDTWLIIIQVWFEEVFNRKPEWLVSEIRKTKIDLFLVCDTDLEWIADPVRENGGEKRDYLQNRYLQLLEDYNFNYKIIRGNGAQRVENAIQVIDSLLKS